MLTYIISVIAGLGLAWPGNPSRFSPGQGRHLFADITDTFFLGQVDMCNLEGAQEDALLTIR